MAEFIPKSISARKSLSPKERFWYDYITDGCVHLNPLEQKAADILAKRYPEIDKNSIEDSFFHGLNPEYKIIETLLKAGYKEEELKKRYNV